MDICHNCRKKQAKYNCEICRRVYCEPCDLYIHSFPSKLKHDRTKISDPYSCNKYPTARNNYTTDKNGFYVYTGNANRNYSSMYDNNRNPPFERCKEAYESPIHSQENDYYSNLSPKSNRLNNVLSPIKTYNLESNDDNNCLYNKLSLSPSPLSATDTLNETNHSIKRNKSFNSPIGSNNLQCLDDKIRLMKKISQLNCELSNARSNIDQKIDVLHDHINCINDLNKKEMIELNYKNINEINIIQSQKDTLIKHLKAVMNDQEETIQKLLKKKQNLEKEISDNKFMIEKYTNEKENYIKEKENNEVLYNEKKNMMIRRHESEIGKIKNDYDTELQRLMTKYGQTKNEYINEIKKGTEIVDDFKSKAQQQVEMLSNEVEKLQNEYDMKNKEQEDYIDKNKKLKKSLDDFNSKYDEMNMKYKNNKDEREKMRQSFHDFRKELQIRKKENTKLHDLKYGRFKFHNN